MRRQYQARVLAVAAGLALGAACNQFPAGPDEQAAGTPTANAARGGAPKASVILEMSDLTVRLIDGLADQASGTITVLDNHLDPAKQITFGVSGIAVTLETKDRGPWPGTTVGSCVGTVESETGLSSLLSYSCTGPIRGSSAARVTAVVEITDAFGNVLTFTARASTKSDSYL